MLMKLGVVTKPISVIRRPTCGVLPIRTTSSKIMLTNQTYPNSVEQISILYVRDIQSARNLFIRIYNKGIEKTVSS